MRSTPGETLPIVTALYEDTQLLVFGEEDGWYKVIALGMAGYMPVEVILFPQIGKTTDTVNLRASVSTESKILEVLPPGTQVHIRRSQDGWPYVADTMRSGYLYSAYVQVGAPGPAEGQPGEKPQSLALTGNLNPRVRLVEDELPDIALHSMQPAEALA